MMIEFKEYNKFNEDVEFILRNNKCNSLINDIENFKIALKDTLLWNNGKIRSIKHINI
ncbi:MAG: hypothetical protein LBM96_03925 [Methanobrevibacter sp.]|jgi:hypothetical protein|nr:hypothetical protein [Candidatus Methanoflexus mossambicus]